MTETTHDIIIAGGGLSGLSLAYYLLEGDYKGSVLIADKSLDTENNKTWCFWTQNEVPFKDLVYKEWPEVRTLALNHDKIHTLNPYGYFCIRAGDFKAYVLQRIRKESSFELIEGDISELKSDQDKSILVTKDGQKFSAPYIFQSILPPKGLKKEQIKYPLIQHFLGWEIKTKSDVFNDKVATFMDFDASWTPGVGFMYLLPWSSNEALLEYTIFSGKLEDREVYEDKIRGYLSNVLNIQEGEYEIVRKEVGQIPMEDRPYLPWYDHRIMNLGTSAGLTKASTGYTFLRIQKHVSELAQSIIKGNDPTPPTKTKARFWYYDLLLLHVLYSTSNVGIKIFRDLFERNRIQRVFKFLDEETSLAEEIRTMASVPYMPFIKAVFANLLK